jgi:hypothetical protein
MAKQNSDVFEVLLGQIGKDAKIDAIFGKALRIFRQAEIAQPIGDPFHTTLLKKDRICEAKVFQRQLRSRGILPRICRG